MNDDVEPALESAIEPDPTVEDILQLAIASARKYSPRCPAEDVAQDVAERWLRQVTKPVAWRGWVKRVAINRANDLMSPDRGAREQVRDAAVETAFLLAQMGPSSAIVDRMRLDEMIGGLPPAERRVLLASLEGNTNAEIAEEFGYSSAASVATVLSKAKNRIRDSIPDVDFELSSHRIYNL